MSVQPTPVPVPTVPTQGMSTGTKIGIVVFVMVIFGAISLVLILFVFKKPASPTTKTSSGSTSGSLSGNGTPVSMPIPAPTTTPTKTSGAPVPPPSPPPTPTTPPPPPPPPPIMAPLKTKILRDPDIIVPSPGIPNPLSAMFPGLPPLQGPPIPAPSSKFHGIKQTAVKMVQIDIPVNLNEPLNLGEVKFYSTKYVESSLIPVSANNVKMSSILHTYGPDNLVDGIPSTFGHTNMSPDSIKRITFTFNNPIKFEQINIYNRQDCCQSRINGLIVSLYDKNNFILAESDPIIYSEYTPTSPYIYEYFFDK